MSRHRDEVMAAARTTGAEITFEYGRLVSGFSARMQPHEAMAVAALPGVASVRPAAVVTMYEAPQLSTLEERARSYTRRPQRSAIGGRGVRVAVIDSGIDYTHAAFGGPGTRAAYDSNDPDVIEPGSFPTSKVIGGYDFVGDDYGVSDNDTSNDTPVPDADPLDRNGHGTHVAGTCCGKPAGEISGGVAARSKILSYKVWDEGDSTADVLVAAFERAVDPNGDGVFDDRPDVINFSGGVDYGTAQSAESVAAEAAVQLGVVVVAAAGNSGNELSGGSAYRVGAPATAPGVIAVAAHDEAQQIAEFSAEGPARNGSLLKPDITARGVGVHAAAVGGGSQGAILSGTSMASPQIAGAAARLSARRPGWKPVRIKAALMNNASPTLRSPDGGRVPAAIMGAGRSRLGRTLRTSAVAWPGSISFGRVYSSSPETLLSSPFKVKNVSRRARDFSVTSGFHVTQLGQAPFEVEVVADAGPVASEAFRLAPGEARSLQMQLTFTPGEVAAEDRMRNWYAEHPDTDGAVTISQDGGGAIRIPWHIVPLAASDVTVSPSSLTLSGADEFGSISVTSSGVEAFVDAYLLGAPDDEESGGEEDISHIAVRSFAGASIDGDSIGVPRGADPLGQLNWLEFLSDRDTVVEPVEFLVRTHGTRDTDETLQATIYIDSGNDGVFADEELQADYALSMRDEGSSCLADLSLSPTVCRAKYYSDYPYYDTNLLGLIVDAADLGLTDGAMEIGYRAVICTDLFSGDVAQPVCDSAGATAQGGSEAAFDIADPALIIDPLVCGGPWDGAPCGDGFTVAKRRQADDGELLMIFPWAPPSTNHAVIPVN